MRPRAGLLVALLVVLAGCSVGYQAPADGAGGPTATPTATPADGTGPTPTPGTPADPATDVLGWESGYWHNESIAVDRSDGLDGDERDALVARTMARVEVIRGLEFREQVPVNVVSREVYREQYAPTTGNVSTSFLAFDNAKFEALFLIGEDRNSLAVQDRNRGSNVLGFYSPRNDTIVIVSDAETPDIDRSTLAHELVHALQDQHTDLLETNRSTREAYNAVNGLIEGEANLVQRRYDERCTGGAWDCLDRPQRSGSGGGDLHLGVYILNYFPYSEGPWFVKSFLADGGWDRVDELYADPPASTAAVVDPSTYDGTAPSVSLEDRQSDAWTRLAPDPRREGSARADHASLGQSGMAAMFAYTLFDPYNQTAVITRDQFLNAEGLQVNQSRPFRYDFPAVAGWAGDRLHVYWQPDATDPANATAYVWKSGWETPAEAREFAAAYRELLAHWGGDRVGPDTWRIDGGPFADAFRVTVEGSSVVVVNAPSVDGLDAVRPGSGS